MVNIYKKSDKMIFDLEAFSTRLAFKNRLSIPVKNIRSAYQNEKYVKNWEGKKMPGAMIPDMLKAGTFQKNHMQYFWAVRELDNVIIVDLVDESYEQLIVEVGNPDESMDIINNAIELV